MSDFTDMLAADRDAVFLDLQHFGETVTWRSRQNSDEETAIVAIVVWDREEGTNQVDGDGQVPETDKGERIRTSAVLWTSVAHAIRDDDVVIVGGETCGVRRQLSHDSAMQSWKIVKTTAIATSKPRLRKYQN